MKQLLLLLFLTLSLHAWVTFVEALDLYEAGEYKKALRAFQELAINDPDAAHMLAKMYERGEGCEANEKEALKWYKVSSKTYNDKE
ncbi:MAG: SEL1-like repeat protein, partial [Sulfurimonas sp.]